MELLTRKKAAAFLNLCNTVKELRASIAITKYGVNRLQDQYNENRRVMLIPGPASSFLQDEVAKLKLQLHFKVNSLIRLRKLLKSAQRGLSYFQNETPELERKLPYFEDGGKVLTASFFLNLVEVELNRTPKGYKVKPRTNHN